MLHLIQRICGIIVTWDFEKSFLSLLWKASTTVFFLCMFFSQRLCFQNSTSYALSKYSSKSGCVESPSYIYGACWPVGAQVFTTSLDTFAKPWLFPDLLTSFFLTIYKGFSISVYLKNHSFHILPHVLAAMPLSVLFFLYWHHWETFIKFLQSVSYLLGSKLFLIFT